MLDLVIVLALVVLNAVAHAAYLRWRKHQRRRTANRLAAARGFGYPMHPSPGFTPGSIGVPDHAVAVRPCGIDW